MTPSQISLLAEKLREQHEPPIATMRPSEHGAASAIFALSHALDAVAAEGGLDAPAEGRAEPHVDETMLRREALDGALRSASGKSTAAECIAGAEVLLGFLRGDPAAARSGRLIGGAPPQVHQAVDRAWQQVSAAPTPSDAMRRTREDDEDLLEVLQQISDDDLGRTMLALQIVRGIALSAQGMAR